MRPLFGLRYIRYTNSLTISGFDAIETLSPSISSRAENNTFGPQFGLRFAYDTKYFSLAADPKVTFGVNRHIDSVSTAQLFSPTEEPTSQKEEKTDFAPVFDLGVSGRIHLSPNWSAFVQLQPDDHRPAVHLVGEHLLQLPAGSTRRPRRRGDLG